MFFNKNEGKEIFGRQYRVFISHSWDYDANFRRTLDVLDSAWFFRYVNTSIPSDAPLNVDDDELEDRLIDLILPAEVVIFAGQHDSILAAANGKWIKTELQVACMLEKPVLLIKTAGISMVPGFVYDAADRMVSFELHNIPAAIKTLANKKNFRKRNKEGFGQSGALQMVHDRDEWKKPGEL